MRDFIPTAEFKKLDPLDYGTSLHNSVMLLNTFVQTGMELKDMYTEYMHTYAYSPNMNSHRRRFESIYSLLMRELELEKCTELRSYIIGVHDYVAKLFTLIEGFANEMSGDN